MNLLDKTVSALVHTVIAEHDRHPENRRPGYALHATEFINGQINHMSAPLRLPMRVATCGLSVLSLLMTGRLLHQLPVDRRRWLVDRWRTSTLGPIRDVIRFYDSLAVLSLYDSEAA
jgi:hypothetical protein